MKKLHTYDEFVNESVNEAKKELREIAKELVEITAKYTDANLADEIRKAARCSTDVLVVSLYHDLLEILTDEDVKAKECIAFEKECMEFLHANGIEF